MKRREKGPSQRPASIAFGVFLSVSPRRQCLAEDPDRSENDKIGRGPQLPLAFPGAFPII
jgi:hypothetical protein